MDAPVSNAQFAKLVYVDLTTASRLRNGLRLPKPDLFSRIIRVFGLSAEEATIAYGAGASKFGEYLDTKVFGRTPEQRQADLQRIRDGQARNDGYRCSRSGTQVGGNDGRRSCSGCGRNIAVRRGRVSVHYSSTVGDRGGGGVDEPAARSVGAESMATA